MKKILSLSAVLTVYVLLCGCPYQSNFKFLQDGSSLPDGICDKPWTGIIGAEGIATGIRATFKFSPLKSPISGLYALNVVVGSNVANYTCCLKTLPNRNGPEYQILDVFDETGNNYYVVVKTTTDATGRLNTVSLLPLPSGISRTPFTDDLQFVRFCYSYFNIIENLRIYPVNTDGGYDNDTEIRGAQ